MPVSRQLALGSNRPFEAGGSTCPASYQTHWHFDHTDGNEWLHSVGAAIIAHENAPATCLRPSALMTGISISHLHPLARSLRP